MGAGVNYIVVAALGTIEVGVDIDGFVVADVGVGEGGGGTVVDGVAGDHSEELASGGDVADDGAVIDFVALDDDHGSIDLEGGDVGCENDAGRGNVIVNVVAAVKGVADNDVLFVADVGVFIVGNGSGGDAFAIDDAGEGANGGDEVGGIGATSVNFGGVDNSTSDGQLFGCDGCKEGVVLRSDIVDGVRAAKGVGDDNGFDAADTGSDVLGMGVDDHIAVVGVNTDEGAGMGDLGAGGSVIHFGGNNLGGIVVADRQLGGLSPQR